MVNLVRIAPTTAEDDPQIEAAKQQIAMAMAQMRGGGPSAAVPIAEGRGAVQAKYGIGNALTDLANKLAQGYVLGQANRQYGDLKTAQDAALTEQNKAKLASLSPAITRGGQVPLQTQLAAVPGEAQKFNPSADLASALAGRQSGMAAPPAVDQPTTLTTNAAVPDQMNPAHAQIASLLAGMDPRAANALLSGIQARNAFPDPAVVEAQRNREAQAAAHEADVKAAREQQLVIANQADQTRRDIADEGNATRRALASSKPGAEPLSADTISNAGWDVLVDPTRMRQYASFGSTGQDIRNTVNNEKTKIMKAAGITEQEVLRQQAVSKAQIKSIGDLVPMRNAVSAYETVARANGDRFLELTKKVNTSGIPIINSTMRLGKLAAGNPDAAEMMQVLQNFQTETARIIANPRLVGQLTDTARKEIENVVPANLTPAQAARIVNRLNFEFELRGRGLDQAITSAQGGIVPGAAPAAAPAATPKRVKVDAQGNVIQ